MIYLDLNPVVSLQGSVGSSVDLVPLAHVLVIVSEGSKCFRNDNAWKNFNKSMTQTRKLNERGECLR